ncbi:hypothetical protein FAF44_04935 [Nonomuraea sp. MG754425]|uniref:hypothetical protein n=1 Tax=Nonomuraea sp. MG754425 TaxID=2570319 RepID=UPI001F1BE049|nr:hypothetical protein [Nonomuraea sp. MG754425]MCF6467756.1 hypothetical protein [Nonomuraea sp. MG754425]
MAPTNNSWHLEPSWPGLVTERDGVTYNPEGLVVIADALRRSTMSITGSGSYPDVEAQREMVKIFANNLVEEAGEYGWKGGPGWVGEWNGGLTFAEALVQSNEELINVYREVNDKLMTAISLIEAGAGTYKRADAANEA